MRFNKNRNSFPKGSYFHKVCLFWGKWLLVTKIKKKIWKFCSKIILENPLKIWFCIFNLGCVTSQSLQYGDIHDSHFKYIQTSITSLFLGRFWKLLHQNKWLVKHFTQDIFTTYIAFPFKVLLLASHFPFWFPILYCEHVTSSSSGEVSG